MTVRRTNGHLEVSQVLVNYVNLVMVTNFGTLNVKNVIQVIIMMGHRQIVVNVNMMDCQTMIELNVYPKMIVINN